MQLLFRLLITRRASLATPRVMSTTAEHIDCATMDRGDLDRLLQLLSELDGSDLHIKAGAAPRIRVNGYLRTLEDEPRFTAEETAALAVGIIPANVKAGVRSQARSGLRVQRCRA